MSLRKTIKNYNLEKIKLFVQMRSGQDGDRSSTKRNKLLNVLFKKN